jgi:hypothetical protein
MQNYNSAAASNKNSDLTRIQTHDHLYMAQYTTITVMNLHYSWNTMRTYDLKS